ncbi:hypothetical protein [Pseudonocardia xishanensis]|uniref:Uncharacterized protein n=1 Tax=Pseudonocardia xishanensis TaxID=630995 RepID=A0ABP8RJ56_9PSEU
MGCTYPERRTTTLRVAPPRGPPQLQHHLGAARSAVRTSPDDAARRAARDRVGVAEHGLGERGDPWWEQDSTTREQRWTDALEALRD